MEDMFWGLLKSVHTNTIQSGRHVHLKIDPYRISVADRHNSVEVKCINKTTQ